MGQIKISSELQQHDTQLADQILLLNWFSFVEKNIGVCDKTTQLGLSPPYADSSLFIPLLLIGG